MSSSGGAALRGGEGEAAAAQRPAGASSGRRAGGVEESPQARWAGRSGECSRGGFIKYRLLSHWGDGGEILEACVRISYALKIPSNNLVT